SLDRFIPHTLTTDADGQPIALCYRRTRLGRTEVAIARYDGKEWRWQPVPGNADTALSNLVCDQGTLSFALFDLVENRLRLVQVSGATCTTSLVWEQPEEEVRREAGQGAAIELLVCLDNQRRLVIAVARRSIPEHGWLRVFHEQPASGAPPT